MSFWKCTRKNCWSVFLEVASCASWFSAAKWDISRRLLFGLSPLTLKRKSTHFSKPLPVQRKQWAAFKTRLLRHTFFLIRTIKIRFVGFLLTWLSYSSLNSSAIFCQEFFYFLESDWLLKKAPPAGYSSFTEDTTERTQSTLWTCVKRYILKTLLDIVVRHFGWSSRSPRSTPSLTRRDPCRNTSYEFKSSHAEGFSNYQSWVMIFRRSSNHKLIISYF